MTAKKWTLDIKGIAFCMHNIAYVAYLPEKKHLLTTAMRMHIRPASIFLA